MSGRHLICAASLAVSLCIASAALAIDASNVLVVYNAGTEGQQIAEHYASVHPGVTLLELTGVSTAEQITHTEYLQTIRPQVAAALTPSIDVIVTTKGMPLRIDCTQSWPSYPAYYTDPQGVDHVVFSTSQRQYSSLESELTRVDMVSTWKQMRDQTWWDPQIDSHAANPYYQRNTAFDFEDPLNQGMRLASRLDGFSASDVNLSIDRAQNAYVGPFGGNYVNSWFVFDDVPVNVNGQATTYDAMDGAIADIAARSLPIVADATDAFLGAAPGQVLGYVSHGQNQGSTPDNYILDAVNGLQFELADGAVFHTWESYNGYSFVEGGNHGGQGLVGEWIARGGTVGIGHVEEPGANLTNVANENVMFEMLLGGYTWAEAAWASTNQLSFVNTVIGDPLMTWRVLLPGDADRDGRVGSSDLALLASNWGEKGSPGGDMWELGDFDGDGRVGSSDMAALSANWGEVAPWAGGSAVGAAQQVPEPATIWLALGAGLLSLFSCRRIRAGHRSA
jgi:uncharacterized protein (TIGR03790 family)